MPDAEDKTGGRVIYSRINTAEEEELALKERKSHGGDHVARAALWQALLPLLVGFTLLIGLVFGLGTLSVGKLQTISSRARGDERRLSEITNRLLNLRLALDRLNTEARIRAQIEAGTRGVLLPPVDLRLRTERSAVENLLPLYDQLPLKQADKKLVIRHDIENYIAVTKDLNRYSLDGFAAYRDVDGKLKDLSDEVSGERTEIEAQRYDALEKAQSEIRFLTWVAALTGLVVAVASLLEVMRRLRQLRRSFDALRRERQFSAQMLEGMVSAIAAVDREDHIRSANAAFFEVFPETRIGAALHETSAAPEAIKMLAAATANHRERPAYHGRWRLPSNGTGKERAFDVYTSPLEIDGATGQLLALVDVTEAAEAEHELRRQESLAAVGKAAAQVAHEIKNPLGSIRLGVAMLRDMTVDQEAITTIDLVERGIEHLSKLTVDVTQFSRLRRLTLSDVDLHELLDASLDLVAEKVSDKATPVEKNFVDERLHAQWDADQLRQVFVNLFANAIDASPKNTPITITTEKVSGGTRRRGDANTPAQFARITIVDQGSGMDEATRARIFEPFFTTKKRGTGLGLAIAKQIVEQHGGTIHAESAPQKGTHFIVDLPL
ncbi:MAG: ATP-binding protein [Pyrinomonadaceae bacterium]